MSKIKSHSILNSENKLYVVIKFFNPELPTIRVKSTEDIINNKVKLKKFLKNISTKIK